MSFPNLLIIGAMKSGTTSLHDYLNKHPDIFMSQPKEIHYYDNLSNLSKADYLNYFKTDKKIIGTTPQNYTKAHHKDFQSIPEKIFRDTPDVRLIYIVRDPFERILSHVLENRFGDTLERANENFKSGHYWKTSLYYYQLSFYLEYFKNEQIHVLTLEDLKANKIKELNRIFKFLNLRELKDEKMFDYIKNDAVSKKIPYFIKSKRWYRLLHKVHPALTEKRAYQLIEQRYKDYLLKPLFESVINEEVISQIRQDALQLEKEFQVNISAWNLNPTLNE